MQYWIAIWQLRSKAISSDPRVQCLKYASEATLRSQTAATNSYVVVKTFPSCHYLQDARSDGSPSGLGELECRLASSFRR